MARPRKSDPRTEQVNFRITKANQDILDAVAYADERPGVDIARELLESYLAKRTEEPAVTALLKVRAGLRNQEKSGD